VKAILCRRLNRSQDRSIRRDESRRASRPLTDVPGRLHRIFRACGPRPAPSGKAGPAAAWADFGREGASRAEAKAAKKAKAPREKRPGLLDLAAEALFGLATRFAFAAGRNQEPHCANGEAHRARAPVQQKETPRAP